MCVDRYNESLPHFREAEQHIDRVYLPSILLNMATALVHIYL